MNLGNTTSFFVASSLFAVSALLCQVTTAADAPAQRIDFDRQVKPILQHHCSKCHAGSQSKGKLSINTREALLKGGSTDAAIVPGKADQSLLIELITSESPELRMPAESDALSAKQIAVLKAWINQGADWPKGFAFGSQTKKDVKPRRPALPNVGPNSATAHPIDRLLDPYFKKHGVTRRQVVSDRLFARRVHLDLTGLLPTPQVLAAFENDKRPDKRARLVDALLEDNRAYADHWMTFWNDALRNAYRGTGYIDGGRKQITGWLYRALYENKTYDRFVYELITGVSGAEGFTYGIKWRGVVNDSQRRELQAAQTISQVFLGTNIKCASCHDSFINDWKLTDAYGLAAVFADGKLEIHRCDKPTGKMADVHFLYPQLGKIDAAAPKAKRIEQLARIVTSADNGRLTRTIVNRLWERLMGRGIVELVDDLDQTPFDADLLDWLAADLQDNGYDLKRTLKLICTSRAYQLPSVGAPVPESAEARNFVFRGPWVKRMSAEQFIDSVSMLTGQWQPVTGAMTKGAGRGQGGQLTAAQTVIGSTRPSATQRSKQGPRVAGQWIWSHKNAASADPGGRIFLRKVVKLSAKPDRAVVVATADNTLALYVNGRRVGATREWTKPIRVDVAKHLRAGENVIAAEAINWPDPETRAGLEVKGANPAGFALTMMGVKNGKADWFVASDATWLWRKVLAKGWNTLQHDVKNWKHAAVLAPGTGGPWKLGAVLTLSADSKAAPASADRVRAVFADRDALMQALGRPNREQVVTRRESAATTLQTLELTNGETLDRLLKAGGRHWVGHGGGDAAASIDALYRATLGRSPNVEEAGVARDLVGERASAEGFQDLLWVLTMLPEFQLIQ